MHFPRASLRGVLRKCLQRWLTLGIGARLLRTLRVGGLPRPLVVALFLVSTQKKHANCDHGRRWVVSVGRRMDCICCVWGMHQGLISKGLAHVFAV